FADIQGKEGATPVLLRSLAIEMTVRLKMELGSMKISAFPLESRFKTSLDSMTKITHRGQLLELVKDMASMAVDMLAREDKSPIIKQVLNHIHQCYAQ